MVGDYESDDDEDSCEVILEGLAMDVLVVVGRAKVACSDFLVQFPSLVIDEGDVDRDGKPNKEYRIEVEVNGHVLLDLGMDYQTPWCVFHNDHGEMRLTKPSSCQLEHLLLLSHDDAMQAIVQWGQPNQLVYRLVEITRGGGTEGVVRGYARGASLFVWSDMDRVVVSDIDGTVTSSDLLSVTHTVVMERYHESFHSNVHDFFSTLVDNRRGGVRIVYLSTRPISLLATTRRLLATPTMRASTSSSDSVVRLPDGPFFCNPHSMARVLFMELVTKTAHRFKADVLQRNIVDVFREASGIHPQPHLWVAGFGNKGTDAKAYQKVGIDHVYIINTSSKIVRYGYDPPRDTPTDCSSAPVEPAKSRLQAVHPESLSIKKKGPTDRSDRSQNREGEEKKSEDTEWMYRTETTDEEAAHNLQVDYSKWCCLPSPKVTLPLPPSSSLYIEANMQLGSKGELHKVGGGNSSPILLSAEVDHAKKPNAPVSHQRLRRRRPSPTMDDMDETREKAMVEVKAVDPRPPIASEKEVKESTHLLVDALQPPEQLQEASYDGYGDEKLIEVLRARLSI